MKGNLKNKVNLVSYWRWLALAFLMLAWLVLHYFLRYPEWVIIPAFLLFLLCSAVICRAYVLGMIGNIYYFFRKPDKAKVFYKQAVKRNTRNVKALYNYAMDALHEGRAQEALDIFKRAYIINTKVIYDKLIPLAISSCYWVLGDVDMAIATILDLMDRYPYVNPSTLSTLGYFYMLKGDYEKAEEVTNKALEDNKNYAPAWDNLGQIEYNKGNKDKAREYFEKALEIRPTMTESLYYLALIVKDEDKEKAKELLQRASDGYISALSSVKREAVEKELKKLNG